MAHIVVLNDGTTYSLIEGCRIVWVDDTALTNNPERIEEWLKDIPRAESAGYLERVALLK